MARLSVRKLCENFADSEWVSRQALEGFGVKSYGAVLARYFGPRRLPTLFSYAIPIAQWDTGQIHITSTIDSPSVTTSKHINLVWNAAPASRRVQVIRDEHGSFFFDRNAA